MLKKLIEYIENYGLSKVLGIIVLSYLTLRAFLTPISDDEYITYREFVNQDVITILTNGKPDIFWAPNNHILNTLCIKASLALFGQHDWAFRLHILLSFSFCYYFIGKLLKLFVHSPWRHLIYSGLFFLNPYLLDFFSIARGYAVSMAGWSFAMYFLILYSEKLALKYLYLVLIGLLVAIAGNFSAIYFLPLFGCIFLYLWIVNRNETITLNRLLVSAGGLVFIVALIALPLYKTLDSGTIVNGGGSFFQDSLVSFIDYSMHKNEHLPRFKKFSENWTMPEIITISLIICWMLIQFVSMLSRKDSVTRKIQAFALFQCIGIITIVLTLHQKLGTPLPFLRTTLLFTFPFSLAFIVGLEVIYQRFNSVKYLLFAFSAFCIWHNAESWNVENTMEWYQNGDAKRVLSYLNQDERKTQNGEKIVLAAEQWQYFSMAFYAQTKYKNSIQLEYTNFSKPVICHYLFAPKHLQNKVWTGFQPVEEFRHGILFKYMP